jgi:hypothetical protein
VQLPEIAVPIDERRIVLSLSTKFADRSKHKVTRLQGGSYPFSHLYGYFGLVRLSDVERSDYTLPEKTFRALRDTLNHLDMGRALCTIRQYWRRG